MQMQYRNFSLNLRWWVDYVHIDGQDRTSGHFSPHFEWVPFSLCEIVHPIEFIHISNDILIKIL